MVGAIPYVLINGVITHHQVDPHPEPGQSTLTVSGRDVSVMMDLEDANAAYPNQPDFVIVAQMLARYPDLGLIPVVTPTADFPIFLQRIPRQARPTCSSFAVWRSATGSCSTSTRRCRT